MKYCSKCGNANTDEAAFCSSCGTPMGQAPVASQPAPAPEPVTYTAPVSAPAPEPVTYTAPPVQPQPPVYTAPAYDTNYTAPAAAPADVKNKATLWLILNIVVTLFCCGGALFSGIGIVFAALGMGSFNKGDYEDMSKKSKISMILFIVGAIIGLITWIGVLIAVVASANY